MPNCPRRPHGVSRRHYKARPFKVDLGHTGVSEHVRSGSMSKYSVLASLIAALCDTGPWDLTHHLLVLNYNWGWKKSACQYLAFRQICAPSSTVTALALLMCRNPSAFAANENIALVFRIAIVLKSVSYIYQCIYISVLVYIYQFIYIYIYIYILIMMQLGRHR